MSELQRFAHDVKNKISVLNLYAQAIVKTIDTDNSQAVQLASKMSDVITDVSDLCSDAMIGPVFSELNIKDFLLSEVAKIKRDFKLDVKCEFNCEPFFNIPKIRLGRILYNLAKNSSEAKASKLRIEAKSKNGELKILLEDNGTGMSAEQIASINKNEKIETTKENGSGLGIESVKNLCHSLGWELVYHLTPANNTQVFLTIKQNKKVQ